MWNITHKCLATHQIGCENVDNVYICVRVLLRCFWISSIQNRCLDRTVSMSYRRFSWWRHQMETFSALLALCAGNSPFSGEFPTQRPVTRSFDVFFDLGLNKRLSKQSKHWWFETQSCSLWRHRNGFQDTAISMTIGFPVKYSVLPWKLTGRCFDSFTAKIPTKFQSDWENTNLVAAKSSTHLRDIYLSVLIFQGVKSVHWTFWLSLACNYGWIFTSPRWIKSYVYRMYRSKCVYLCVALWYVLSFAICDIFMYEAQRWLLVKLTCYTCI